MSRKVSIHCWNDFFTIWRWLSNTADENSSVFSLIWMRCLPSVRACGQWNFAPTKSSGFNWGCRLMQVVPVYNSHKMVVAAAGVCLSPVHVPAMMPKWLVQIFESLLPWAVTVSYCSTCRELQLCIDSWASVACRWLPADGCFVEDQSASIIATDEGHWIHRPWHLTDLHTGLWLVFDVCCAPCGPGFCCYISRES